VTAYLFGAIGFIVTSYVRMINNFSFFTTGIITPLFFFAGTFFPVRGHHAVVDAIWLLLPLSHPIELARMLFRQDFPAAALLLHGGFLVGYTLLCHVLALRRMTWRVLRGPST
jgi:lipooligosaccharide transport system permease protein